MYASEADLRAAIARGDFEENHYREAKVIVEGSSRGTNKELARDLAQFALDGGTVVFGISEDKAARSFALAPFQVEAGVVERIEQIALTQCQPPLPVTPRFIPADEQDDPQLGYVVVEVPVSPAAPHMVDGKYLGRGHATKRYLSDSEVRGHHASRAADLEVADRRLNDLIAHDPLATEEGRNAHFFAVAIPLGASSAAVAADADRELAHTVYLAGCAGVQTSELMLSSYLTAFRVRGAGCVLASYASLGDDDQLAGLTDDEKQRSRLDGTAEFGVRHDGGVWAYHSRLSKKDGQQKTLFPDHLVQGVRIVVAGAAAWARIRQFHGSWSLGVAATGLAGAKAIDPGWTMMPILTDQDFRRTTQATTAELTSDVDAVVARLTDRFLAMCSQP